MKNAVLYLQVGIICMFLYIHNYVFIAIRPLPALCHCHTTVASTVIILPIPAATYLGGVHEAK